MSRYRKPGKQEAYEAALVYTATIPDENMFGSDQLIYVFKAVRDSGQFVRGELTTNDLRDVAAKAIRVERGRRLGGSQTTKLSIDLHTADMDKLDRIRAEGNHSTKVAAIRSLIRNECDRLDAQPDDSAAQDKFYDDRNRKQPRRKHVLPSDVGEIAPG